MTPIGGNPALLIVLTFWQVSWNYAVSPHDLDACSRNCPAMAARGPMKVTDKRRAWRLFYVLCCLVYMGWVSYLGSNDFGRVQREYRRAGEQVEPGRIHAAALQELLKECRKRSEIQPADSHAAENVLQNGLTVEGGTADLDCLAWPPAVVEAREAEVRARLLESQKRAGWKLLLFSLFFVVIFLILPPVVIYFFMVFIAKLFSAVKIVRK